MLISAFDISSNYPRPQHTPIVFVQLYTWIDIRVRFTQMFMEQVQVYNQIPFDLNES